MTQERYFPIDSSSLGEDEAVLKGDEFHHLAHVVRAKVGQELILLDGSGGVYSARVTSIGQDEAHLEILGVSRAERPHPIDLALPALKASRLDLAVEKCTEVGFARLIIFSSRRSIWKGGEREAARKGERLERKIMAACKQSGQSFFPVIDGFTDLDGLIERIPGYGRAYLADPGGVRLDETAKSADDRGVLAIVGPEGGFTERERTELVASGALPVSLGGARLRSETAAICLLYSLRSYLERKIDSGAQG
jgi:16S rRNA (uracil1498-N3)-methyltransferase